MPLDALLVRTSFTQSVLHPPCPDDLWNHCWHCAYHAIFYLDYYATRSDQEFTPPEPFGLSELEPDKMPARIYSKKELLIYLSYASAKCKLAVEAMTDDSLTAPCLFKRRNLTVAELFLYNMRQVQHHTGQLNLMISQHLGQAPRWVQSSHL